MPGRCRLVRLAAWGLAGLIAALLWARPLPVQAAETLRIGFVIGQTGPGAPDESDLWRGALLAVEELNAAAGTDTASVSLTAYDTHNLPIMAKAAAKEAIAAGADLLLAPSYSSQALEVARVAQHHRVPMISVIATHPDITAVGECIFSVCFTDSEQAATMAAFARGELSATTAVILTDLTSAYSMAMTAAFRERFTALGGRVLDEIEYKMRQRDFTEVARQAMKSHPDVLFLPGYWLDSVAVITALDQIGTPPILLGGDGWGSALFAKRRGSLPARGYYTDHWATFMMDDASQRFRQAFVNRFGAQPVAGAALAYDAVRVAAAAAARAHPTNHEALCRAIATIRDFPGLTGRMTFVPREEMQKSVHLMEIIQGKARILKTVNPK